MSLYLRVQMTDGVSRVDISTGDEVSMLEMIKGLEECTGTFTVDSPCGITYIIEMEKVAYWTPIDLRPQEERHVRPV